MEISKKGVTGQHATSTHQRLFKIVLDLLAWNMGTPRMMRLHLGAAIQTTANLWTFEVCRVV
jgi:hypothetical protein